MIALSVCTFIRSRSNRSELTPLWPGEYSQMTPLEKCEAGWINGSVGSVQVLRPPFAAAAAAGVSRSSRMSRRSGSNGRSGSSSSSSSSSSSNGSNGSNSRRSSNKQQQQLKQLQLQKVEQYPHSASGVHFVRGLQRPSHLAPRDPLSKADSLAGAVAGAQKLKAGFWRAWRQVCYQAYDETFETKGGALISAMRARGSFCCTLRRRNPRPPPTHSPATVAALLSSRRPLPRWPAKHLSRAVVESSCREHVLRALRFDRSLPSGSRGEGQQNQFDQFDGSCADKSSWGSGVLRWEDLDTRYSVSFLFQVPPPR